jgi:hypothetical protein
MAHRVKTQRWHRGRLVTEEFTFESFEDAQVFATSARSDFEIKIYDHEGQVVHKQGAVAGTNDQSYA